MTERSVAHAAFTIERHYDAAPATVFKAFADPAAKRSWFAEGRGSTLDAFDMDFRVGGHERSRSRLKDGRPVVNDTTYHDIVPNERIIFAYVMTIDGRRISASLATIEFAPEGNGTRLGFTEQGAFLDRLDQSVQREEGWRALLESLAGALGRSRPAA